MSGRPELWIVAGPNGAGKTTCVQTEPIRQILPRIRFFNPDDVTRQLLIARGFRGFADAPADVQFECFREAATQVERDLMSAMDRRESVGIETVLSTDKYRKIVEWVRAAGGRVNLIFITIASPEISSARVALRVARGGHGVPAEKIPERYRRSHENLAWFAAHADCFWVIDNSGSDLTAPPLLRAYGGNGQLEFVDATGHPTLAAALEKIPWRIV